MEKLNKVRHYVILASVIIMLVAAVGYMSSQPNFIYAAEIQNDTKISVDNIFADKDVEDAGYLYNYDGSIDFVYVDFSDASGYVIFAEETMEILEYCTSGNFPYNQSVVSKYYGGPNAYFERNGNTLINVLTGDALEFNTMPLIQEAEKIRDYLSIKGKSTSENFELLTNCSDILTDIEQLNYRSQINTQSLDYPPLNEDEFISPTSAATYIENSEYFLTEGESPRHGLNSEGTCTTVAIQLLLSYNNYYNDRRIIPDEYLFGNATINPERNPNYCADPNSIDSYILGSNQAFHDMLVEDYNITGFFDASAQGLQDYLNDRNIDGDVTYTYTASGSLNQSVVLAELNAGRPIVLETTSRLNGTPYGTQREINHAVIAYGYQSFAAYEGTGNSTVYDGYIVNFGWDYNGTDNYNQIWTNANWFNNAISLQLNHVHDYSSTNQTIEGVGVIMKCDSCGHRITSLQNKNVITDIGYQGSTYYWSGEINMSYGYMNNIVDDMLIIEDESQLSFTIETTASSNAFLVIDGEIQFQLTSADEEIIQSSTCDVHVDLLNNVTLTGNTFIIDTSLLDTGLYTLTVSSNFTRGTWQDGNTYTYMFAINRPFTIMDGFGYNASWYKWNGRVDVSSDALYMLANDLNGLTLMGDIPVVFTVKSDSAYNAWTQISGSITFTLKDSNGNVVPINGSNSHVTNVTVGLVSNVTISNGSFSISGSDLADGSYTLTLNCTMSKGDTTYNTSDTYSFYVQNALCVAEDTLITLADGTQKEVEDLTGNEELLVWNLLTGEFDSAPILFVDSDAPNLYQVIELHFSDGTTVDVIGEHAFWSVEQNEYVFLRNDAAQYIGDSFMKRTINGFGVAEMSEVELVNVIVETEYTTAWSPVTYGHLCYYVNGMLSMPGATEGLINIFEVDPTTMKYDEIAMNNDIATYGLFTYEEFNSLIPIEEEMFDAFNGQYLKVAIGKGLIDMDELEMLVERYEEYLIG